jgi:hypothetical protein
MSSCLIIKSEKSTLNTDCISGQGILNANRQGNDTILISFTGYAPLPGLLQNFDFKTILINNFKDIDKHFYIDRNQCSYHKGIQGISNNIEETTSYLENEIKNYKNVIFIGISSGGYAAILFGSLLNITKVIAFIPQTILFKKDQDYNEKYIDLLPIINNTTKYYLYGDLSITNKDNCHHISHCERINEARDKDNHYKIRDNVFLTKYNNFNIRLLRNNGELLNILTKYLT